MVLLLLISLMAMMATGTSSGAENLLLAEMGKMPPMYSSGFSRWPPPGNCLYLQHVWFFVFLWLWSCEVCVWKGSLLTKAPQPRWECGCEGARSRQCWPCSCYCSSPPSDKYTGLKPSKPVYVQIGIKIEQSCFKNGVGESARWWRRDREVEPGLESNPLVCLTFLCICLETGCSRK